MAHCIAAILTEVVIPSVVLGIVSPSLRVSPVISVPASAILKTDSSALNKSGDNMYAPPLHRPVVKG